MFEKIKQFFKKDDGVKISITINGDVYENVSKKDAAKIIKKLTIKER